jgi:integrase
LAHLTSQLVEQARRGTAPVGRYRDRATPGLLLIVKGNGASWILRYQIRGRRRDLGLGAVKLVRLSRARELANARRVEIRIEKRDPLEDRSNVSKRLSFDAAARAYIESQAPGWRDRRAVQTWTSTLKTYASPVIGSLGVDTITVQHLLAILGPIWPTKPETASRVRGRVESVLAWCGAQGLRSGANPATWKGNLQALLPAKGKVKPPTRHHAALDLKLLPKVWRQLATSDDLAANAIALCIATATRPGETLHAAWAEFDVEARVWELPATRTKKARRHRIPLSDSVLALLGRIPRHGEALFPGVTPKLLRRALDAAGGQGATVHGTSRANFADHCTTHRFDHQLIKFSLSHYPQGATDRAYFREDLLHERRALAESWGAYLDG